MTKFRTTGHDFLRSTSKPKIRPNDPPPGRVGVYVNGQRRAHVGPHAGVGVVSKLLGGGSASMGKVKGKPAWIATAPSRTNAIARAASAKLATQRRTDKGSVGKR
jgi:hypothetical protein